MVWGVIGLVAVVVVWELVAVIADLPSVTLPRPWAVFQRIFDDPVIFWDQGLVTLREILIGFVVAAVAGILLGILIATSQVIERVFYPVLVVSQAVPKVAIAPLFVIWFGFGATANVAMAGVIAIFPVIINTALGISAINSGYIKLGKSMGANKIRMFWMIRFPAALPNIFAGLKLAITLATIGAVVGEFLAGQTGLGYLTNFAAGQLDTELAFASIVMLSVLGVVLFYAVVAIEHFLVRWRPSEVR